MDEETARQREVLEKLAREIARRGMCAPAIFIFESVRPLTFVAGQALAFIEPLLKVMFHAPDYAIFREAIEGRENVGWLVGRLEGLQGDGG